MAKMVVPTFKKLHYNQAEGTYTSKKTKRIVEEYETQVADMSQNMPEGVEPTPADHAGVFVGVGQDPTKHRVFGIRSLYTASPCSVTSVIPPAQERGVAEGPGGDCGPWQPLADFGAQCTEERRQ